MLRWQQKKACNFNKGFFLIISKTLIDYDKKMDSQNHSVLLEVTKTKQDSKKKLLSTKDNCHLV